MLKRFYPSEYAESVFLIDYQKLYEKGYKGLIFDIDNTLVHHGDDSNEKVDKLFEILKNIGFKTVLLTNNDEKRVKRFIKNIDTMYICDANKPNIVGYLKAVEMMDINKEEAIFIGDQLFTDILGANKSKIESILVKFIQIDKSAKIGKKRQVEKIIMNCYKRNKKCFNRLNVTANKENEI